MIWYGHRNLRKQTQLPMKCWKKQEDNLHKKAGEESSILELILGEKVDSSFDDENIAETMNELKRKIKVDIILETEYGYSTVWID